MAAMSVGGDPGELPVERFNQLLESFGDIEALKAGEGIEKRRDRKLLEKLERVIYD